MIKLVLKNHSLKVPFLIKGFDTSTILYSHSIMMYYLDKYYLIHNFLRWAKLVAFV
jgi:hypothetical protein